MNIYIDSDNKITLSGLKETITDTYINADAVVTGQVYSGAGEIVTAVGSAVTFSYESASEGVYTSEIPNTIDIAQRRGILFLIELRVLYQGKLTTFRLPLEPVYKNISN
jgi:hypothetical protein